MAYVFPRAPRRQAIALGAVAAMACAPLLSTAARADNLDDQNSKVKKGIKAAQAELEGSSKDVARTHQQVTGAQQRLAAAQRKLAGTQKQLDAAMQRDSVLQQRLQVAQQRLADARAKVKHSKQRIAAQRELINRTVSDNLASGDPQLLEMGALLSGGTPADVSTQVGAVQGVQDVQESQLKAFTAEKKRLEASEREVQQVEESVAADRAEAAVVLKKKVSLQSAAAAQQKSVATTLAEHKLAAAAAQKAKAADAARLAVLRQQESAIKAKILARAKKQRNQVVGSSSGMLAQPTDSGVITSPFGWRIHPIYGYRGLHDGDDFRALCGSPLKAARAGTVISQVWSDVYGNRLYLDMGKINGSNFTAIYNHMQKYDVRQGQRVSRGQVLGQAGTTGWSTGCHLHFTVLKNGEPVKPSGYM